MKFRNLVKIMVLCVSIGVTALAAEQTNKVESKTLGTELKEYGKIYKIFDNCNNCWRFSRIFGN